MPRVRRLGDWLAADVGPDRVLMNVESGHYLGFTSTGALIWDLLDEARTVDEVCALLVQRYDVEPQRCTDEVRAFLEELAKLGAVTFMPLEP